MLDQVLDALGTMADRLGQAIAFSNRYPNDTAHPWSQWLSNDDAKELEDEARVAHEQWSQDYTSALHALAKLDFPDVYSWWFEFPTPQIAFSVSPTRNEPGVWVLGGGGDPVDQAIPPGFFAIEACEVRKAMLSVPVKRVAGYFDDRGVRQWETVLLDIEGAIRRVSETLFIVKSSLGGIEAEKFGKLLAKVAEDRKKRSPGRPASQLVAKRRQEVAKMKAGGHGPTRIVKVLAPEFPGITTQTVKDDLAAIKNASKGE